MLILDPLRNLFTSEGKLPGSIRDIQQREICLRRRLATYSQDTVSGCGDRSASFVTGVDVISIGGMTTRIEITNEDVEVKATMP